MPHLSATLSLPAATSLAYIRGRGEAEVYLKLHRGSQNNAYISMQSPSLELLVQAESRRREELMRSLEPLVKVRRAKFCVRPTKGPKGRLHTEGKVKPDYRTRATERRKEIGPFSRRCSPIQHRTSTECPEA